MRSERKIFLSQPEVCFLDATRFVRSVLTGVRVANFFNIANFDLIFLHNTHILAVLLSVGLFSFPICLSRLSVCLVCLSLLFSTEGMYVGTFVYLYICLFVFLPSCTYALSVCLSVCLCMSVYVSMSLFLFVCMCI